jgi:hypothetical protein
VRGWFLQVGIFLAFFGVNLPVMVQAESVQELWEKIRAEKEITVDALIEDFISVTVVPRQWVYENREPRAGLGWDMGALDHGKSIKKWGDRTLIRVFGHTLSKERGFLERQFPELEALTGLRFVFQDFECPETKDCIEVNFFGSKKNPVYRKYCLDCLDSGRRYPLGIYRLNTIASKFITKLYRGDLNQGPKEYKYEGLRWNYFNQISTYFTQYKITKDNPIRTPHNVKGFVVSTPKNEISYASCGVPSDSIIEKNSVQTLVLECLVRSLGLFQVSKFDNGVIGRWSKVRQFMPIIQLSSYDRLLIRLHYSSAISIGMDGDEVRPIIRKILSSEVEK